jgi:Secretion system C-terminal sorting domain
MHKSIYNQVVNQTFFLIFHPFKENLCFRNAQIRIFMRFLYRSNIHSSSKILVMRYFVFAVLVLWSAQSAMAQHRACGTTDLQLIAARLKAHLASPILIETRAETVYFPIKFHLVAQDDGSNRISETKVLDQLCSINAFFSDQNIQFYIKDGFNYINNSAMFLKQSGDALFEMSKARAATGKNAMHVFICSQARSESSDGLAYYVPNTDWIVVRNDEINATTKTLEHEVGHYFGLLHTFNGWEGNPYNAAKHGNPVTSNYAPGYSGRAPYLEVEVELADGTNCKSAGDFICDTPPDYDFGENWSGCTPFTLQVKDPKGSLVSPMIENIMGYFYGCKSYLFTKEQKAIMAKDAAARASISTTTSPSAPTIAAKPLLSLPAYDAVLSNNVVDFTWGAVADATYYLVEIDRLQSFSSPTILRKVVKEPKVTVTGLFTDRTYNWRVTPFNALYGCATPSATGRFRTGLLSAVDETGLYVNDLAVFPNPTEVQTAFLLRCTAETAFYTNITLYNITGQLISQKQNIPIANGENSISIAAPQVSGIYFVQMTTPKGVLREKVIVRHL